MPFVNSTLFLVLFTMFLVYHEIEAKIKYDILMLRSMHLHTEIYPNLKRIYQFMKSPDSSILASRDNWVSCNQTLNCLRLYGDSRVSRAQPRINAYEILLQLAIDWLLFFFLDIICSLKHIATYNFHLR